MALLFEVDRTRITRHIKNIFEELELEENCNVRKTHFPFSDKDVTLYNLEVVIAVEYRVKSKRGNLQWQRISKRKNMGKKCPSSFK